MSKFNSAPARGSSCCRCTISSVRQTGLRIITHFLSNGTKAVECALQKKRSWVLSFFGYWKLVTDLNSHQSLSSAVWILISSIFRACCYDRPHLVPFVYLPIYSYKPGFLYACSCYLVMTLDWADQAGNWRDTSLSSATGNVKCILGAERSYL